MTAITVANMRDELQRLRAEFDDLKAQHEERLWRVERTQSFAYDHGYARGRDIGWSEAHGPVAFTPTPPALADTYWVMTGPERIVGAAYVVAFEGAVELAFPNEVSRPPHAWELPLLFGPRVAPPLPDGARARDYSGVAMAGGERRG